MSMRRFTAPGIASAFLAAATGWTGCHSTVSTGPSAPFSATTFQQHSTAHFAFRYTSIDAPSIADTAARVEGEHARIISDLQATPMSSVTVTLHPDFASLQDAVRSAAGTLPAFAKGLTTGVASIHVLSPNLSNAWSYADGVTAIVHEFAHCVSLQVNPTVGNNPRWLWEAVAIFEAGQFVHPRSVMSLVNGEPPTISRLNGFDNTEIYAVGFVMGEFIVARWGGGSLVALIRGNGNVAAVTGMGENEFLAAWYQFVSVRYLSS